MDLYRHLTVKLKSNNVSEQTIDFLYDELDSKMSKLQNMLNSNHSCFEIHVVAVKNNPKETKTPDGRSHTNH